MSGLRDPLAGPAPQSDATSTPAGRRAAAPAMARIESDGTPGGTHVLLADGTELSQVQSISWDLAAGDPSAVITVRLGLGSISASGRLDMQAARTPRSTQTINRRTTP